MVALAVRNSHNKISINAAPHRSLSSLVHASIVPDVPLQCGMQAKFRL